VFCGGPRELVVSEFILNRMAEKKRMTHTKDMYKSKDER